MDDATKLQTALAVIATAAGVKNPVTGAIIGTIACFMNIVKIDGAWREEADNLWSEILFEEQAERRSQYQSTQDEFTRHWHIIEWLKEELVRLNGRVDGLEAMALGLVEMGNDIVRARPEPEMREYLRAALDNTLRRRDVFPPVWVRRLQGVLAQVSAEHITFLCRMAEASSESRTIVKPQVWWDDLRAGDQELLIRELESLKLVVMPSIYSRNNGEMIGVGNLTLMGWKLRDFVTRIAHPGDER